MADSFQENCSDIRQRSEPVTWAKINAERKQFACGEKMPTTALRQGLKGQMKTTVKIGSNEFSIALRPIEDCAEYVKRHGNGAVGWGAIIIEGQWLRETFEWDRPNIEHRNGTDWIRDGRGTPYHPHSVMVVKEVAFDYGSDVPMNEVGMDMARRRVEWLAKREPALVEKWLYLKTERAKASQIGDVTREQVVLPVTEVKPWREGNNPHPDALVYDLPGRKGSLPWWYTLPEPEGTPCGHPRYLVHFPETVSQEEWFGKKYTVKARVWKTAHRHDNGPGYNYSTLNIRVVEGPWEGTMLGKRSVGTHFEFIAVKEGEEIGWFGDLPKCPAPPQPVAPYKNGEICDLNNLHRRHTSANGEAVEAYISLYVYWPKPAKVLLIKA